MLFFLPGGHFVPLGPRKASANPSPRRTVAPLRSVFGPRQIRAGPLIDEDLAPRTAGALRMRFYLPVLWAVPLKNKAPRLESKGAGNTAAWPEQWASITPYRIDATAGWLGLPQPRTCVSFRSPSRHSLYRGS